MDIADIITEFGNYYEKRPENMNHLVKQLNQPSVTESLLTPLVTDDTHYRCAETQFTRVVQAFQQAWTPLNPLNVVPVEIQMFKQKVDLDESPHQLEATWLGFLTGPEIDVKEWPFIRWYMEVHLLPQIDEDIELNEIYKGVRVEPGVGVAGASGAAMDGLRKIINAHVTAGSCTPIVMGAIPLTNLETYEYFELFADKIGKKYWNIPMQLGVDQAVARRAIRGKREKYGKDIMKVDALTVIEDTNISIMGLPSMGGAEKIWCTPKWNSVYLRKKTQNMKQFKVESVKRVLSLYSDWWIGVGFHIPGIVFTNDRDLI